MSIFPTDEEISEGYKQENVLLEKQIKLLQKQIKTLNLIICIANTAKKIPHTYQHLVQKHALCVDGLSTN